VPAGSGRFLGLCQRHPERLLLVLLLVRPRLLKGVSGDGPCGSTAHRQPRSTDHLPDRRTNGVRNCERQTPAADVTARTAPPTGAAPSMRPITNLAICSSTVGQSTSDARTCRYWPRLRLSQDAVKRHFLCVLAAPDQPSHKSARPDKDADGHSNSADEERCHGVSPVTYRQVNDAHDKRGKTHEQAPVAADAATEAAERGRACAVVQRFHPAADAHRTIIPQNVV
jgi:hypothetical protein